MPTKGFGETLRAARVAAGLSQEALAQAIGSDQATISQFERHKQRPRYEQAVALARHLGAPADEWLALAGYDPVGPLLPRLTPGPMSDDDARVWKLVWSNPQLAAMLKRAMARETDPAVMDEILLRAFSITAKAIELELERVGPVGSADQRLAV